jgi:hypothetical protein
LATERPGARGLPQADAFSMRVNTGPSTEASSSAQRPSSRTAARSIAIRVCVSGITKSGPDSCCDRSSVSDSDNKQHGNASERNGVMKAPRG